MNAHSRGCRQNLYGCSGFRLDVGDRRLTRGTCPVHLPQKTYGLLVGLVRGAYRLVTKHELLESIWPADVVEERILTVPVAALRRASGDTRRAPVCIETVSRPGDRFRARVTHGSTSPCSTASPSGWRDREVRP